MRYFTDVGHNAKGETRQVSQIMQCSLPNLLMGGKMRWIKEEGVSRRPGETL